MLTLLKWTARHWRDLRSFNIILKVHGTAHKLSIVRNDPRIDPDCTSVKCVKLVKNKIK